MPDAPHPAALIYGPDLHYLDHLAPLCCFMGIPLIVTEERIAHLAARYYPGIEVHCWDYLSVAEQLVSRFDIVFYCMPRDLFDEIFFFAQKMLQKRVHAIWCPHGNSDKGHTIFYMEALKKEEAALLYGKQMIECLKRKGSFDQLKGHVVTGNFRRQFYIAHKAFYDAIVAKEITGKLPKADKTLLYAPTWQDYEKSTSFFDATLPLIETLPANHNLIIKLHPNLVQQEDWNTEELILNHEDKENILFLREFPVIYPLLQISDIYIGDMSSVGYDYLSFDRPMFFLNQNRRDAEADRGLYLFRCGIEIPPERYKEIHTLIAHYFEFELRSFSEIRRTVYSYAFGHEKPLAELKREIEHLYSLFPEKGLDFF